MRGNSFPYIFIFFSLIQWKIWIFHYFIMILLIYFDSDIKFEVRTYLHLNFGCTEWWNLKIIHFNIMTVRRFRFLLQYQIKGWQVKEKMRYLKSAIEGIVNKTIQWKLLTDNEITEFLAYSQNLHSIEKGKWN